MLENLRSVDQEFFFWIQAHLRSESLDSMFLFFSNLYFWTPFFVFLAFLLFMQDPKKGFQNLFFSAASLIISFQAAFLLSYFIHSPAPYVLEHFTTGKQLPGFEDIMAYSLPDWGIAAYAGIFIFVRLRLRRFRNWVRLVGIPVGILIGFSRVYAGIAFPLDILLGVPVGLAFGLLFAKFLDHWEYVMMKRN